MKLKDRVRVGTTIREIYALFGNRQKIPASEGLKYISGSNVTRVLARRFAGCRSVNIAGRHVWLRPKVPMEKALAHAARNSKATLYQVAEGKKEKATREATSLSGVFLEVMHHIGYDRHPRDVLAEAREATGRTYPRGVVSLARRIAGIKSMRRSGSWHWLYPAPEIVPWLQERMKKGPMLQDTLFALAHEKGWTPLVINCFRMGHGFKQWYGIDPVGPNSGTVCWWYDMNTWSPE